MVSVGPVDFRDNRPLPDFSRAAKGHCRDRDSPPAMSRVKLMPAVPTPAEKSDLLCGNRPAKDSYRGAFLFPNLSPAFSRGLCHPFSTGCGARRSPIASISTCSPIPPVKRSRCSPRRRSRSSRMPTSCAISGRWFAAASTSNV